MLVTVKILRSRGIRKAERDILSGPGHVGDLTMTACGPSYDLKLADPADAQMKPLIPLLNYAQVVTIHGAKMLFRGIERAADGAEYVQEWSVLVKGS